VGCYTSGGGGGSEELVLKLFVVAFCPDLSARMVHEVSRMEDAERRRAHSADHAGLEVEEPARGTYLPPEASW
jgi:hypothetical protein